MRRLVALAKEYLDLIFVFCTVLWVLILYFYIIIKEFG